LLMDQDDPEKRIADLERQLAEQKRGADRPPVASERPQAGSISNSDPARRRFVVSVMPKAWQRYSVIGLLFLALGVFVKFIKFFSTNHGAMVGMLVFFVIFSLAGQWVFVGRKVVIRVTTDGLTVSKRPGDVFSFRDAELGQWRKTGGRFEYVGRALFLTSGPHRFVLAGDIKNPGNPSQVPVEGPQVKAQDLDASTKSSAFDELLAIIGSAPGR
jgi:hypothetical protein